MATTDPNPPAKRRRIRLALCLLGLAIAVMLCLWSGARKEPQYHGKTVREWLVEYILAQDFPARRAKTRRVPLVVTNRAGVAVTVQMPMPVNPGREALHAFAEQGDDPLPWIILEARRKDRGFDKPYRAMRARLPDSIQRTLPERPEAGGPAQCNALEVLAGLAPTDVALAELTVALSHPNDAVKKTAVRVLATMGARAAPALPAMARMIREEKGSVQFEGIAWTAIVASQAGADSPPELREALVSALNPQDPGNAPVALDALRRLHMEGSDVNEALGNMARYSVNQRTRDWAASMSSATNSPGSSLSTP